MLTDSFIGVPRSLFARVGAVDRHPSLRVALSGNENRLVVMCTPTPSEEYYAVLLNNLRTS